MELSGTVRTAQGAFTNEAPGLGLNISDTATAWLDYNNDGWVDVYTFNGLWRNNDGLSVTQVAAWNSLTVCGDYDNDGFIDRFDYGSDSDGSGNNLKLYRNTEGTGFELKPFPALTIPRATSACWGDYNGDGFIDLYICGQGESPFRPDSIAMNDGDGTFTVTWTSTSNFPARCAVACDFDEDGDIDIFVSNYRLQPNSLWLNGGGGIFANQAPTYGVSGADPFWGHAHTIGSGWGDFDNDGHFDLFVGNFAHPAGFFNPGDPRQPESQFLRNRGPGNPNPANDWHFEDMSVSANLAFQESHAVPALADYDNDGDLDFYLTAVYAGENPVLYSNNGNWTFTDVTTQEGLAGLHTTSQAAWGDFNNDGFPDLITANRLLINQDNGNHWLKVKLRSDTAGINRFALGAQVRILLDDGRTVTRQVDGGAGQGNQNEQTLLFGLGAQTAPVTLLIRWPDGSEQTETGVAVDQLVCVKKTVYKDSDINQDTYVNATDFAMLVADWLACNDPNTANCNP